MRILFLLFLCSNLIWSADQWDRDQLLKEGLELLDKKPAQALPLLERAYFAGYPDATVTNALKKAYHIIIMADLEKKQFAAGIKKAEQASLIFSNAFEFLKYRMIFAKEQQNYNLCIFYGQELSSIFGANDEINYLQAFSYHRLKAYRQAIDKLKNITKKFPAYRSALVMLGDSYYHHGILEKALDYLNQSQTLEKTPDVSQLIEKIEKEMQIEKNYLSSDPSPHFVIKTLADEMAESEGFLTQLLENIYTEFVGVFQFHPETPITVVIYGTDRQTDAARLGMPDWSAGIYDGEIRIPMTEFKEQKQQLETILRHELVHLFIDAMTRNSVPVWFNEGCAQFYEMPFVFSGTEAFTDRNEAPVPKGFKDIVVNALKKKQTLSVSVLNASFMHLSGEKARLAYAQSLYMFRYFISRYGLWKLQRLLRTVYDGGLFEVAFREETGSTADTFLQEWIIFQKNLWKLP